MIVKSTPFQSKDYYQSLAVRDSVLRIPLGLSFDPEQLIQENTDVHLIAKLENRVVATMILTPAIAAAKMRQVAVLPEFQKGGIGRDLVSKFETIASEMNFDKIELHARANAVPFYEKLGYSIVGDWFEEVGIPHLKMEKYPIKRV